MTAARDYDEVPYSKYPYPQTHPDRLATLGTLMGLAPAPPTRCRVLELGGGAGGNVIPLAYAAPELRAVCIDVSARAIEEGRRTAAALGLENVELVEGDLRDLRGGELGEFDYVLAHGVYAWVPEDVRDALLEVMAAHLAPEGVAFVSYNALPGGYMRRMLSDMGLWHARQRHSPLERAATAQELFRFLAEHRVAEDTYGAVLGRELRRVVARPLHTLVHDDLGDATAAFWFADFAEHAGRHGLSFLAEAELAELEADRLPPGVEPAVRELAGGDRVAFEQYSDFLLGRKFRQTLLCHAARPVDGGLDPDRLRGLRFLSNAVPDGAPADGLLPRAIVALEAVWPATLGFDELRDGVGADADGLAAALLHAVSTGLVEPHADPPRWAPHPGERPRASALARLQAADSVDLTTLRHENLRMEEPAARRLLGLLDGTRSREEILAELAGGNDALVLAREDLERNLEALAGAALLHA